jgi:Zn-dependent M28 family amino/carboxypeptidase
MILKLVFMSKINYIFILLVIFAFPGCNLKDKTIESGLESITAEEMKDHLSVLASDDFLGRFPATIGEEKTVRYLEEQFKQIGLEPANGNSYFQVVSLVKLTADVPMKLNITGGKENLSLVFSDDFIGGSPQLKELIQINKSDIIFVGYGINSPEYDWNDYKGLDVKGKTVLMLVNDPGYATSDTSLFNGKAMTIYGRWTYKFEEAARQGAAAAIIIHETGAAAYPWAVVQNSFSGPQYYLAGDELSESDLQLHGWITTESARKIFESSGLDYDQITTAAAKRGFKPFNMNLKASVSFTNQVEYTKSNNVAAVWPGSDQSDEYIIYTAHWDHFGVNPAFREDSILNGAVDNATGTAALLEIAEAFTRLPKRQSRSILFLSVTCEEQGLLGSKFYAENPLFPLNETAAVINMDALNISGKTNDMTIVGFGNSGLDVYAVSVLEKHGRYASPDATPEKGMYFRSDHFSFANAGVPVLFLSKGYDDVIHGKKWGLTETEKWIMEHYHKTSDNYEPDIWKFDGMIDDIKIFFEVGYDLSMTDEFPEWKPGSTFKPLRDEMMKN